MSPADPIVAIATAPGRGAVGIVRISGKGLALLADRICGRTLLPRVATYLGFQDDAGQPIDRGLALFFPAPNSYTGEDVLELQGHGGPLVLQLLLARVLGAGSEADPATGEPCVPGLRLAQPGEFTQRAFLHGKIDLAQAESIADLIDASTEAAARSAARSLSGAFSAETTRLLDTLVRLRMLVEATLDFPEEEIDFLKQSDAQGQLARLRQSVQTVLATARQGALLRDGVKIVIAGQPNAGKSSLLNALAGAELAIVTPVPGTTRDTIASTIQIEGVPIHVIDTAGLRDSSDAVERIGIARAWAQVETADAVLFVHDLSRMDAINYIAEDARLVSEMGQKIPKNVPLLPIWNKLDAAVAVAPDDGLALSAKTGAGLSELRRALLEMAGWQSLPEGTFIARARHVQVLTRVAAHLQEAAAWLDAGALQLELVAEELRLAQQRLSEITGAFTPDDLLGEIFSRFCIGK